jgi:transposase
LFEYVSFLLYAAGGEGASVLQTQSAPTGQHNTTNGPRCLGCLERDDIIAQLRTRLKQSQTQLRKLLDRSRRHSGNSSIPPSANPLDAPKSQARKKSSGRKRGGQPNHAPANRAMVPAEELAEPPIACIPDACEHCDAALVGVDPLPLRHQVTELPPINPEIREYQQHLLRCPHCGEMTRGQLPDGVPEGAFGPRLQAFIGLCTGCYHLSKRQTEELLTTALNVPICLGSICRVEQQISAALAEPVAEAHEHLRQSAVANADETSWKEQPRKAWLWAGVTAAVAVFLIRRKRDLASAYALLGEAFAGVVVSDRYSLYQRFQHWQICWAHLRRDWKAFIDRGGTSKTIGQGLLELTDRMFHEWHRVRDGTLTRLVFFCRMIPLRNQVVAWLREGTTCAHPETAGTCRAILKVQHALWTFTDVEGVEPTNNAAERVLRQAVLWRKKSFGTRSAAGSRYVERILTVVATCRLQGRSPLEYLTAACKAALQRRPAPSLIPKPAQTTSNQP